jgi:crossover junction endodeoxyribonuclease RuvC
VIAPVSNWLWRPERRFLTPMRILGLDPGLARVGYGLIEVRERQGSQSGEQRLLDCGMIRTDPGRSDGERMVEIAHDLRLLIRTWSPDLAAVEKFFFYRSSTTIAVVQARGVLMMTLARFRIPALEFPPMQIKQALTGHGHAQKEEVLEAVMRELDLSEPPRPDDAADALAVALTGWFQQ